MGRHQVFEGPIAPKSKIVSHDGPDTYIAYIVAGHGVKGNNAPDGSQASNFEFGTGNVVVFGPGTMHDWKNGDKQITFIGFQRPTVNEGN